MCDICGMPDVLVETSSLKEMSNSSNKRPLDFEKKRQLNSEKYSAKYQWSHRQPHPLR